MEIELKANFAQLKNKVLNMRMLSNKTIVVSFAYKFCVIPICY